jgi:hypothetical protein
MKRFLAKAQRTGLPAPFKRLKKILFHQKSWKTILPAIFLLAAGLFLLSNFMFPKVKEYSFAGQDEARSQNVKPDPGQGNETGGPLQDFKETDQVPVEGETVPRVILITLDKITYQDLLSFSGPVLSSLLEESAVALMNVNTAAVPSTESGYLTIGSGSRLAANWTARKAFNRRDSWHSDEVEALYRRHTGSTDVPQGEVLHLYSGVLRRLNEKRPYPALVGALGEAISGKGLGVAVLGNADSDTHNRQVVTIAMNREGAVAYGDVGSSLFKEKDLFPFGKGSDPLAYLKALEPLWKKAAFIVVEWGDTSRIDDYLVHLPYERRGELLRASLQELDQFLLRIRPYLTGGTRLILLAPSLPNPPFSGGQRLAPVVYYDPGSAGKGLLVSATTRRPGIITNIDIAPTVLSALGVETPVFLFGTPVRVSPAANHLEKLAALSERIVRVYNQRPAVIKGYLMVQMVLLLGALGGLFFRVSKVKVFRPGLYTLLFFPPAALLATAFPAFPASSLYANAFLLVALTILLTLFAVFLFPNLLAFFSFTGLLIFGLLAADLFRGAPWMGQSFLGYDPVGGARFYGMGNEYMGIMVGSFILGFGSLIALVLKEGKMAAEGEKKKAAAQRAVAYIVWIFIFCSFLVLFLMASPVYGANFGGAVTAGVALAVTLGGLLALLKQEGYLLLPFPRHRAAGQKVPTFPFPQKVLLLAFFVLVTGAFLYFLNIPRSDAAVSHLGRTLDLVRSDGLQELWKIALRKMEMNMKLVRYSLWSRVLFIFIFLITALYFYPVGLTKKIFQDKPGFKAALGGIIAGSFTSFLVNDSGVITAATTMLYGGLPLLLFCFKEVFP